jgi:hypothetical protein
VQRFPVVVARAPRYPKCPAHITFAVAKVVNRNTSRSIPKLRKKRPIPSLKEIPPRGTLERKAVSQPAKVIRKSIPLMLVPLHHVPLVAPVVCLYL